MTQQEYDAMLQEYDAMLAEMRALRIYRIIRFRQGCKPRTIRSNVTLTEAQEHCSREDTSGVPDVHWFDGYDYMRGCSPKGE